MPVYGGSRRVLTLGGAAGIALSPASRPPGVRRGASLTGRARKVEPTSEAWAKSEWQALASDGSEDRNAQEELNEISTSTLRALLKGSDEDIVDRIIALEEKREKSTEDKELQAFLSVLIGILSHEYVESEAQKLRDTFYERPLAKLYAIVEDSGWNMSGLEAESIGGIDDELMQPPPTFTSY